MVISIFLLIFVLVFSFAVLIPEGKDYRINRTDFRKENLELKRLIDFSAKKKSRSFKNFKAITYM